MLKAAKILPLIITTIIVSLCVYLGQWQLARKAEKYELFEDVKANIAKDKLTLKTPKSAKWAKDNIFRTIELEGYFYLDKIIFLYGGGRKNLEDDSYFVLAPFRNLATDENILVKLGSVETKQEVEDRFNFNHNIISISGRLLPGEKGSWLAPDNDIENNTWFYIDIAQAGSVLNMNLAPFYIDLTRDTRNKDINDAEISRITPRGHLVYAIIWFTFAIISAIIYFTYIVNTAKQNQSYDK